ncbi:MAG: DUF1566 domain-containing protein [Labrys sp. (in: a-proteobacteria)]
MMARFGAVVLVLLVGLMPRPGQAGEAVEARSPVISTGQDRCYALTGEAITCPTRGLPLAGQDAAHPGHLAIYRDNGDGTVSERVTGLQWAKAPSAPMVFAETAAYARQSRLGSYSDWRVPTIRELYTLIDFRGGFMGDPATGLLPVSWTRS